MASKQDGKWRGTITQVIEAPIDTVWPILADFDGLHRHFPEIFSSCETVEGVKNEVGSLRSLSSPLPDGSVIKAKERLLTCDDASHTTSYSIEEINFGWTGYVAHIIAATVENAHTRVDWSYELNPAEKQTEEEINQQMKGLFNAMLSVLKGKFSK